MLAKICTREDYENLTPDREFAVDKGMIKLGRYQPFLLEQELCTKSIANSSTVKVLQIDRPGLLGTLLWVERSSSEILEANHVEIETRTVGLECAMRGLRVQIYRLMELGHRYFNCSSFVRL